MFRRSSGRSAGWPATTGPGPDGSLAAVALSGGPPASSGDIVLGQHTLASLGVRVGQTVSVGLAGFSRHVPFVVTGTAVFPAVGAVALAVGIPVGLLCGREAWGFFAGQLGISDVTRIPVLSFVLLAVAGLALAVAVASVPGISASRIHPADALRAE